MNIPHGILSIASKAQYGVIKRADKNLIELGIDVRKDCPDIHMSVKDTDKSFTLSKQMFCMMR